MTSSPHHRTALDRTALIVISHPDEASFNHAIAGTSAAALEALGFTTHLCDLYADGFDPVITKAEIRGRPTEDALTKHYIGLLASAEVLVVVHPNCWGAPPAMMKGWMDRVFTEGSAYAFEKSSDQGDAPQGLLRTPIAIVFNTSNTREDRERTEFGDPLERIWKDCLLRYCGIRKTIRRVFRIIATSSLGDREKWLSEVRRTIDDEARPAAFVGMQTKDI
jgi:putative NADPH-quinone reductase